MILRVKKELYKDENDFVIEGDNFKATVAKYIKSYAVYNENGSQMAQIEFKELAAKIIIAESGAFSVVRRGDKYIVDNAFVDDTDVPNKDAKKQNKTKYLIYGKPLEYKYDIYEQTPNDKNPKVAANVINDTGDNNFYKIRTVGGNMLKLLTISLAIAKLNSDPQSLY